MQIDQDYSFCGWIELAVVLAAIRLKANLGKDLLPPVGSLGLLDLLLRGQGDEAQQ